MFYGSYVTIFFFLEYDSTYYLILHCILLLALDVEITFPANCSPSCRYCSLFITMPSCDEQVISIMKHIHSGNILDNQTKVKYCVTDISMMDVKSNVEII